MISGVPLFRGRDNQDQLLHIMRIIGTPDDRVLRKIATDSVRGPKLPPVFIFTSSPDSRKLLSSNTPNTPNFPFNKFSQKRRLRVRPLLRIKKPSVDVILIAIDLLERLLQFDPSKRITATEALSHPYFTSTASPAYGPSPTPGSMPPPQFNFPHPHPHVHHQPQPQVPQQQQQTQQPQQIIVQQPGQQLVPQQPGYPPHPQSMFVTQDAARMQVQAQVQAMAQAQAQVAHAHAQAHVNPQGYGAGGYPAQYQHPR